MAAMSRFCRKYVSQNSLKIVASYSHPSEILALLVSCVKVKVVLFVCLFVCFVALRPKSTAMVIAGRSVHLTTLFPGQA